MLKSGIWIDCKSFYRKACIPSLAFCWCGGIFLGMLAGCSAGDVTVSLMRTLGCSGVSIVALFFSQAFPFLISAFAVYISAAWLIYPISFVKAFTFSLCASLLTIAYGSAGWLLRILLMFSDLCLCPALLFFWTRYIRGEARLNWADCVVSVLLIAAVVYLDHSLVSPFLQAIMYY